MRVLPKTVKQTRKIENLGKFWSLPTTIFPVNTYVCTNTTQYSLIRDGDCYQHIHHQTVFMIHRPSHLVPALIIFKKTFVNFFRTFFLFRKCFSYYIYSIYEQPVPKNLCAQFFFCHIKKSNELFFEKKWSVKSMFPKPFRHVWILTREPTVEIEFFLGLSNH